MEFAKMKMISQKYKDIISGYVKRAQSELPTDNVYFNIVEIIQNLILLYYASVFESAFLNQVEHDKFLSLLSDNNKSIVNYPWKLLYQSSKDGLTKATFTEKVHHKRNVLLLIKLKDDGAESIVGGYTKSEWDVDEPSVTSSYNTWHSDKDAFVYCFRANTHSLFQMLTKIRRVSNMR